MNEDFDDLFESPKKWVRHEASEPPPPAPTTPEIRAIREARPVIDEELLDEIRGKTELPKKRVKYGKNKDLWLTVSELKRWMTRKSELVDFQFAPWERLKATLERAAKDSDIATFDQFADAWQELKTSSEALSDHPVARRIQNMIPVRLETPSPSPLKIKILGIIEQLQETLGRAPTQAEILAASETRLENGITDGELSVLLKEVGLRDLLSRA